MTSLQPLFRHGQAHDVGADGFFGPGVLIGLLAPVERWDAPEARIGALPVLRWLMRTLAPRLMVEVGVAEGTSYLDLCALSGGQGRCLGIDAWDGADDLHRELSRRHDPRFVPRSTLLRANAETAALSVADGAVDLLHVALDTDEAGLDAALAAWLPKLGASGGLALAGIEGRAKAAFARLARRHPTFAFAHDGGLGLVAVGAEPPPALAWLVGLAEDEARVVQALFLALAIQSQEGARARRLEHMVHERDAASARERARQNGDALHLAGLLEQARQREEGLRRQLDQVQLQLGEMRRSSSWRLTAPLRRLAAKLAGVKAGLRPGVAPPPVARAVQEAPPPPPQDPKEAFKERMAGELAAFLGTSERLVLPSSPTPKVSILLVLYNQAPLTFGCLKALVDTVDLPAEVIIVDNASSDRTGELLDRLDGARVFRNTENLHFLRAVNQGAGEAIGQTLLLLNNDACLRPGALQAAFESLYAADDIGAVGGKIVLLDGTLQEAGSIIWNDGTCLGYGRGRDPNAPEFQFARDVDYCSGAFLLVRRNVFEDLGRLDMAFAPAYYEETDFCMRLRAAGWRILYDPRVEILHFEFGSATSSEQALALQKRNHALFLERHRQTLARDHLPPGTSPLVARMGRPKRGRVLFIEDRVPYPSLGAGYPRATDIVATLAGAGWFVTFYPLIYPDAEVSAIHAHFPRDVEFMTGQGQDHLGAFLEARAGYYDTILISRPHNMRLFLEHHRARPELYRDVRVVYDAEAVFAPREAKRLALAGTPVSAAREAAMLREELDLAAIANTVLTVNEREAQLFRAAGHRGVHVLGHALVPGPLDPAVLESAPGGRRDILFVGALDDDPSPNADSLLWFVGEVMGHLDRLLGADYRLIVVGRCGAERIRRLASPRVHLLGRVDRLLDVFADARLFIAPTRYAAGMPHKVHEAVSRGLPVVATGLLAAQLGWRDEGELLVADEAEAFAAACARLYTDDALWRRLRQTALASLARDCDPDLFTRSLLGALVR